MSRIGVKPIEVLSGVTVDIQGAHVVVKGPKGELSYTAPTGITIVMGDDNTIVVTRESEEKQVRSFHGLVRSLISNMIQGVSEGFEKQLEVVGVGYRFQISGKKLTLSLGFSHPVEMNVPEGIEVEQDADNKNVLKIRGADKQLVGEFTANIRKLRKPEPYKGKGIKYVGERIIRKAGKAAAAK